MPKKVFAFNPHITPAMCGEDSDPYLTTDPQDVTDLIPDMGMTLTEFVEAYPHMIVFIEEN